MVWFKCGASQLRDDCHYECFGPWEGRWNSSTFDPAHLWFSLPPPSLSHTPLPHPPLGQNFIRDLHQSLRPWEEKNQRCPVPLRISDNVFTKTRVGGNDSVFFHENRGKVWSSPFDHSYRCHSAFHKSPHVSRWLPGTSDCLSLPCMASAPLVHEGKFPLRGRPVPPKRRKQKRERGVAGRGLKELEYVHLEPISDIDCRPHFCGKSVNKTSVSGSDRNFNTMTNNKYLQCADSMHYAECGGRDINVDSFGGIGNGRYVIENENYPSYEGARSGEQPSVAATKATTEAAGVSGCKHVPSLGGTRGRRRPPPPPPPPPRRCFPPPSPPLLPSPPQSSWTPSAPTPSASFGQRHPSRTLWQFLTCWVVRGKMADWDVDLSSPTYCAACAVMDTRAEECCSSAWNTAEAWWGSFICPSWKCGGCVQPEVIKETPKSSFTLPKPTVCPLSKFKIEFSLDLADWRTTSATTISSPNISSKPSSIPNESPSLSVPVPNCKSTAAVFPQTTQYYVGVPTWIHLRSTESCMLPPEVRGEHPQAPLWVPESSPPSPSPSSLSLSRHGNRLRRMFPSRLLTKRLSDVKTAQDFSNNNLVKLTFKMKRLATPSSPSSTLTTLRCYARTCRRYLSCARLKTRLKTRLRMCRAYVSNQLYR